LGEFIFQVAERAESYATLPGQTRHEEVGKAQDKELNEVNESAFDFTGLADAHPMLPHLEILRFRHIAKKLNCTTHPFFIQGIATKSARIVLRDNEIESLAAFGKNASDDASIEAFIRIVAVHSENLALRQYGSTDNGFYAAPRPSKADNFNS
jgi:hypothetical protein